MTTETEPTTQTLTKNDLAALRKANVASFHARLRYESYRWVGSSDIALSRRIPNAGPLDETEKRYDITCQSTLRDYADNDQARFWTNGVYCHAMEHTCSMAQDWQTFVRCCKIGDVVSLHWVKDIWAVGYAQNKDGETMHCDKMELHLTRKIGKQKIVLVFNLCLSLCPHNSARMIRAR